MRWHPDTDIFQGLRTIIDFRTDARSEYETRIASAATILDIGGRNGASRSARRLRYLGRNHAIRITCTDIIPDYAPDLVDDITDSKIPSESFDAVYCDAILEHVKDYQAAARHIFRILKPGGQVFICVPFCWSFHDRMDFHRFTFVETARLVDGFSERRLFVCDGRGYGGVVSLVLSFFRIARIPWLWSLTSFLLNIPIVLGLWLWFVTERARGKWPGLSWREFRYYFLHLSFSHSYAVWAKK